MTNFKKLRIWTEAFQICSEMYKLTAEFPSHELYALTSQMRRAAVSIVSNIAEGGSRSSVKEKARFMEMALGSAFELETQLLIAIDIGYSPAAAAKQLLHKIEAIQKAINALRNNMIKSQQHKHDQSTAKKPSSQ